MSRSPQGERGLKYRHRDGVGAGTRRSPQGERGLKYPLAHPITVTPRVAPRKGSVD